MEYNVLTTCKKTSKQMLYKHSVTHLQLIIGQYFTFVKTIIIDHTGIALVMIIHYNSSTITPL